MPALWGTNLRIPRTLLAIGALAAIVICSRELAHIYIRQQTILDFTRDPSQSYPLRRGGIVMRDLSDATTWGDESIRQRMRRRLRGLFVVDRAVDRIGLDGMGLPIKSLRPLALFPELRSFRAAFTSKLDLTPLASCRNLTDLEYVNSYQQDFSVLTYLNLLGRVCLRNTRINDLSPLATCRSLEYLSIDNTPVVSLAPIAGLVLIRDLSAINTNVDELWPLAAMQEMESLTLRGSKVNDLTALANLKSLIRLDVGGTRVSDVSPLANLPILGYLHIDDTDVTNLDPLLACPQLKEVVIGSRRGNGNAVWNEGVLKQLRNKCRVVWSDDKASDASLPE